MKFYEIDLTQIIPYGIPLNNESHVEYTDYINEFFLRGFQNWFNRLYTVEDSDLIRDYSRSCTAPYSLDACKFCSDSQLQTMITEAGFIYYSNNAHDINAKFVYDLAKYPFGTEAYLTTIAQYVANSGDVYAEAVYNATGSANDATYGMTANEAINVLRNREDIQMPAFTEDGEAWVKRYERERLVELAFENHRFWDVRRWKKGAQYFKNIQVATLSSNLMLTRSNVSRQWDDKYYFYPIPQSELKKNSHLVQNPGW